MRQVVSKAYNCVRRMKYHFKCILSLLTARTTRICIATAFVGTVILICCLLPKKGKAATWPEDQTTDVGELIHPMQTTSILTPKNICSERHQYESSLLIVVCSSTHHAKQRQTIRDTWAKRILPFPGKVDIVFLLGELAKPTNASQFALDEESARFGDILQESFLDSYANLTIKSLMMLKWFANHCSKHYQYLMKTDDDMYINIPQLLNLVNQNTNMNMLTGFLHCGALPITEPSHKQFAPPYMLSGLDMDAATVYPNFLSGTAYIMSKSTALILYRLSKIIPAFHLGISQ